MLQGPSRRRLVVADDSPTAIRLVRAALASEPYEILSAHDGHTVVDLVRRELPALVLLDVKLPRLRGVEVCRRLRESFATRAIPVLLTTSQGDESHLREGFEAGCTGFVRKPFDVAELVRKVRTFAGPVDLPPPPSSRSPRSRPGR